ncbi:hypothetical protein EZV62_013630 [Acer yangbiense]|uniref:Enhancer of rudimentary homolog n=1 Tax=Acer yangbiense TaxID=1000413 RepID=A0A5C7HYW3_9ROSI|nr:hypothetical protein EZV62_013630 [Acer yangbiense]
MANRHTIILMQTSQNRATRTFMDYESVSQAMDGICRLYERKLKDLNPANRDITYDVADLYNFIDGLADMSALVYVSLSLSLSLSQHYKATTITQFRDTCHMTDSGLSSGYFNTSRNWHTKFNGLYNVRQNRVPLEESRSKSIGYSSVEIKTLIWPVCVGLRLF